MKICAICKMNNEQIFFVDYGTRDKYVVYCEKLWGKEKLDYNVEFTAFVRVELNGVLVKCVIPKELCKKHKALVKKNKNIMLKLIKEGVKS